MKKEKSNYRIYLILADENLFHPHYLTGLIVLLKEKNYKIVGVTLAKDSYKHGFVKAVIKQIQLWGLLPFAFIAFNSIFRTFLFKFSLSNNKTIEGISIKNKIPLVESLNVNSPDHLSHLRKLKVDFIISSNGQIFKKDLLRIPIIACINRHSALLPKYGGVLPVFWAMKNKEKNIGASAHYMVEQIDKGDILSFGSFDNKKGNSLFVNYMLAFDISIRVTVEAIENALKRKIVKKFKHNKDEYYSFPKSADIKEFKKHNRTFSFRDILSYYRLYGN